MSVKYSAHKSFRSELTATSIQIDNILPRIYNGSRGTLKLQKSTIVLHCRPAELYLASSTFDKQLKMEVYWDKNVYDEPNVTEWLADVVEATKHYLGDDKNAKLQ
jgi:hypothetical protein